MAFDTLDKLSRQGKDVTEALATLRQARLNITEMFDYLPLKDLPIFKIEHLGANFLARQSEAVPPTIKTEADLVWPCRKPSGSGSFSTAKGRPIP